MNLGAAIQKIRKEKKIKQQELADFCGVNFNTISNIERNKTMPRKELIKKICDGLGISVAYLLFSTIEREDIIENARPTFDALAPGIKKILE